MLDIVARAQKTRLPAGERDERDRALRRGLGAAERLRERHEPGNAARVVLRPPDHRAARIAAEPIPVSTVNDVFVLAPDSRQHAITLRESKRLIVFSTAASTFSPSGMALKPACAAAWIERS